jgi:hypothetical protein
MSQRMIRRAHYTAVIRGAAAWADGGAASSDVRAYLSELPLEREDHFAQRADDDNDRVFWLGEVHDAIRADIEGDLALTKTDRAHLLADIERRTAGRVQRRREARMNPSLPSKAIKMFRKFHTRDWRGEGDFHGDLKIPNEIYLVGNAVHTLYASDKLNPTDGKDEGWIEYIHEHEHAVKVYSTDPRAGGDGQLTKVPAWIRNCDQFTWLGKSLGFAYRDGSGTKHDVDATAPLPELYTIPSGKALLIIQGKRRLLAMLWGGRLAVERRGIVY